MSKERIARVYSELEQIIGGVSKAGAALHVGNLIAQLVSVNAELEEAIQDVMDVPAPGSIIIAEEPQLKLSDEEVWLRAWMATATSEQNRNCSALQADTCLKNFNDRFREEPVKTEEVVENGT